MFKSLKNTLFFACSFLMLCAIAAPPHALDKLPNSEFWLIRRISESRRDKDCIRFLKLANRGRYGSEYKNTGLPPDRRAPRPEMMKDYPVKNLGNIKDVKIPLELLDEAGLSRNAAEVRVGVPLPQRGLFSLQNLRIEDEAGRIVPAHFDLLSKWQDGSMRFVLVSFSVPLKANEKKIWHLRAGTIINRNESDRVKMVQDENTITVTTPVLKAVIDKKKFNLLKSAGIFDHISKKFVNAGNFSPDGIVLVDAAGRKLSSAVTPPDDIAVEEQGGERLALRIGGILGEKKSTGNIRYIVRLYFKSTTPTVKANIQIINADLERELYDFNEVYVDYKPYFDVTGIALCAKGDKNINSGNFIRQYSHNKFAFSDVKNIKSGKLDDWIAIMGSDRTKRFAAGFADFAARWPKGVAVVAGSVRFELLPPLPGKDYAKDFPTHLVANFCEGKYRHYWGTAFMEQLFFDFGGGSYNVAGAEAGKPVIAVIPASWYEKCGVFPGANGNVPGLEHRVNEMLANIKISQENDQETGYFNYGDWFGERAINWGNNEYDTGYLYWQQFVRTGNRDFYRLAIAAARHQANTDTVHAFPNRRYIGGDHYHGIGHVGSADYTPAYQVPNGLSVNGMANNGHTWVRGLLSAWTLAGEAASCDAALLIGEQLRMQAKIQGRMASQARVTAWQLIANCALYSFKPEPEYLVAAEKIVDIQLAEQDFEHGGIWARKLRHKPDAQPVQTIFMLGVAAQSMVEWHRITGDPRVEKSIIAAAKWIADGFDWKEHAFHYDEAWDRSERNPLLVCNMKSYLGGVLMYAALLTGDAELVKVADAMLDMRLYRGFGVKKDMNMSQVFLGDWLDGRRKWTLRHPEKAYKFDREEFRSRFLKDHAPGFHARSMKPMRFAVQLKSPEAEVMFRRNLIFNGKNDVKLTVTDLSGKKISEQNFAHTDVKDNKISCRLSGKANEIFFIDLEDGNVYFWDVMPSEKFAAFLKMDKYTVMRRPNLRRYYFTVPEGTEEFKIRLFASMTGFISAALRTPDGKVAAEFEHTKIDVKDFVPGTDAIGKSLWFDMVKAPVPGVWSVDFAVESDGAFGLVGIPSWLSTTPDKLPPQLK